MADFVSAMELCEQMEAVTATSGYVFDHVEDSDNFEHLCFLGQAVRDAKQALAEVEKRVHQQILATRPMTADPKTGELKPVKAVQVLGIAGEVEFPRSVTRKAWSNERLWSDIVRLCKEKEWDEVQVLGEVIGPGDDVGPNWRIKPLRALGFDVADYCIETWGEETVQLPARALEDRGQSFEDVA